MSSCRVCHRSLASIRCLICQEYFCLTCSGTHRHSHLLDSLEHRLNTQIDALPKQFNEHFQRQYRQAADHLHSWMDEVRRQFDIRLQYELEKLLESQFELLKRRTDGYVHEYVQHFVTLRSNVRYAKQRQTDAYHDHEILRLVGIEKGLLEQYQDHRLQFRLDTHPIDFTKFINVHKQFHESSIPASLDFNYRLKQPIQSLSLNPTIQHIASSCLDLFVFVLEPPPKYPSLLEFSTCSIVSKITLEHSVEFPRDTQMIDMCWSVQFNCLFLLTPTSVHKYEKYERKIHPNAIELADQTTRWHRLTTNRFGIYILNEDNAIDFYNQKLVQTATFQMHERIKDVCLVYDLQGQADCLSTLTYTKEKTWQVDLFSNRQLELKRTLQLSESLRPPLTLISGNRRNMWIVVDGEQHRLIVFDDRMKNIEHFSLGVTPQCATVLDDKTLVVASSDVPGGRLSFYSSDTNP